MKKTLIIFFVVITGIIILSGAVYNDEDLDKLLSKLESIRIEYPQEKVHVHFDKQYYSIGEDIWFKAYIVNAEKNELSALSKVLYVDFIDDQDSIRATTVLPIVNGLSSGAITLSDSIFNAGNYRLRAYTKWMQNFDEDFMFTKKISIGDAWSASNIIAGADFTKKDKKTTARITFQNASDNAPVAGKAVTYEIKKNNRILSSGKVVTDVNGEANVSLQDVEGNDNLFIETVIKLGPNLFSKKGFAVEPVPDKIDLQFFPEGGKMVNGIRSKIAYKAIDAYGKSVGVSGYIVDSNNQKLIEFKAEHLGMGVFVLQPLAGENYSAIVKDLKGNEQRFPLPKADEQGYVLGVNNLGADSLIVKVAATFTIEKEDAASLIAMQNGVVKYITKINRNQKSVNIKLARERFDSGILQFTLFSFKYLPIAERLIFINNNDYLSLNVTGNLPAYSKRQKVDLEITARDFKSSPVQGSFSIAVTDIQKKDADEDDETTIYSNLLLTSDLKGYIEQPNYYFNHPDALKAKYLDYLMLSQGWRRFNWADIGSGRLPVINFPVQKGISITGKVTSMARTPIPFGKIALFGKTADGPMLLDTVADDKGNFKINDLIFSGEAKFVARAKGAKGKDNVKITFNDDQKVFKPKFYPSNNFLSDVDILDYLQSIQARQNNLGTAVLKEKSIILKDVQIIKKKNIEDGLYVKGSDKITTSVADIVIRKEKLKQYSNLLQAFYGLAGVEVRGGLVYRVGHRSITGGLILMQIYANGVPLAPDMLGDIPPSDVEAIEILKSGHNASVYNAAGVIVLTLKRGGEDVIPAISSAMNYIYVKGYSKVKEFYAPKYEVKSDRQNDTDLRSTIYWNPNLVTDASGKAALSFYTADLPGKYKVVIEGLTIDGRLGRQVETLLVK